LAERMILRTPDGRVVQLFERFSDGFWGCDVFANDDLKCEGHAFEFVEIKEAELLKFERLHP